MGRADDSIPERNVREQILVPVYLRFQMHLVHVGVQRLQRKKLRGSAVVPLALCETRALPAHVLSHNFPSGEGLQEHCLINVQLVMCSGATNQIALLPSKRPPAWEVLLSPLGDQRIEV